MKHFDVVVIGGGIHGAGVAQAVAAAGYSVCLLEREALAAGSSSRSSKLIHGGLRYLESAQLRLVRECLRERELLLRLAPDLVTLRAHYIPVYRETRRRPWQLRAGLSLYALLGGLRESVRFASVAPGEWDHLDGLRTRGLQRVYRYFDAQTDDRALTEAVMASAVQLGAELQMPASVQSVRREAGGFAVNFKEGAGEREVYARTLVNAAGPWVNRVLQRISPPPRRLSMELVQGAHILLPGELHQGVYYTESPQDGRAVFVMPWHDGQILVGTTETPYMGDPAKVHPLSAEIAYLRQTVAHYFPHFSGVAEQASFAGLRVLPGGGIAFSRARDTRLLWEDGLLSLYGGKLTAYRATAQQVLRRLLQALPARTPRADTANLPLRPPG